MKGLLRSGWWVWFYFAWAAQATAGQGPTDARAMIGSALDWYMHWQTDETARPMQTCSGSYSDNLLHLLCLPLDVAITVAVAADESCSIRFLRPGHGLSSATSASGFDRSLPRPLRRCTGLPQSAADFPLHIEPRARPLDPGLSRSAQAAARSYLQYFPRQCSGLFPLVRAGDPFFHVYVRCRGALESVLEFPIREGKPADFSHWDYSKRSFPQGYRQRLRTAAHWLPDVTPEWRRGRGQSLR
jgi:hypothetical protein